MLLVALGMTFSLQYLLIFNKNNFTCGILSSSDIVGICPVRFCPVGFCLWGFCPVRFCPVGYRPNTRLRASGTAIKIVISKGV